MVGGEGCLPRDAGTVKQSSTLNIKCIRRKNLLCNESRLPKAQVTQTQRETKGGCEYSE